MATKKKPAPKKTEADDKKAETKAERQPPDDNKLAIVDIPANEPYPTKED